MSRCIALHFSPQLSPLALSLSLFLSHTHTMYFFLSLSPPPPLCVPLSNSHSLIHSLSLPPLYVFLSLPLKISHTIEILVHRKARNFLDLDMSIPIPRHGKAWKDLVLDLNHRSWPRPIRWPWHIPWHRPRFRPRPWPRPRNRPIPWPWPRPWHVSWPRPWTKLP